MRCRCAMRAGRAGAHVAGNFGAQKKASHRRALLTARCEAGDATLTGFFKGPAVGCTYHVWRPFSICRPRHYIPVMKMLTSKHLYLNGKSDNVGAVVQRFL